MQIGTESVIAPGTLVGGRFIIERHLGADVLGETLLARDEKTNKPIAVRVLSAALAGDPQAFDAIRAEIRNAAKLKHRSLAGTYGIGTYGDQHFVACEWMQGEPLSELIARRAASGELLSLRGAYNVVAHVCKALAQGKPALCHGALRPGVVFITKSGRVKVGELGLGLALATSGKWQLLEPEEQAFLAPEVREQGTVSPQTDVFGIGAILYALLTGRSLALPYVQPSYVRDDASEALDAVVSRCLAAKPTARFQDAEAVVGALLPLVAGTPEPSGLELGVDLEIDVDVARSLAPPAIDVEIAGSLAPIAPSPAGGAAPRLPSSPLAPVIAARAPMPTAPRAKGGPLAAPEPPRAPAPAPAPPKGPDLNALMAKLTENDAARWIAVKGGLDHGPFTARELIKLIVEGEVLESHTLLNMSNGDKKPLGEWKEFHEFVEQYKLHKAEADHVAALEKSTRIERTSNAAKFVFLGSSIALLLVVGGGYLLSRQAAKRREAQREIDIAAMFESGKVKITGTAGILQATPHHAGQKHSGGGAEHGGSTGFTSYDDAMNQAMELGDATKGGGERQLRTADIQAVMDRKLNSLFGCVSQELRSGKHLGNVQIDLAILGSGHVMGASINTGSSSFKQCIAAKVRQISFASFPAPRMGARYSFSVD